MAKKFGKFLLFTAAVGTAAAAAYYYIQKKDSSLSDFAEEDDDYDDFSEDLEDDADTTRSYVSLSFNSDQNAAQDTEDTTVSESFSFEEEPEETATTPQESKDDFIPLFNEVSTPEDTEYNAETTVEEFFDEEDSDDEEPPIIDSDDE